MQQNAREGPVRDGIQFAWSPGDPWQDSQSMRDFIVLAIILGAAPICFINPYFGVLMWCWISYFNPHRFTWGMAYNFPVAQVVAIPTLLGAFFAHKKNNGVFVRETFLLAALWVWFAVTFYYASQQPFFASHAAEGQAQLIRVSKILLMTMVTIWLVTSKERLRYLLLLIALTFGLFAVKGTLFGFRTGGQFRVWGPPDSFVADNNDFGLVMNMSLPILFFLAREEKKRWLRWILRGMFCCGIVTVILTYSRGAMLGLAVVLCSLALKSRHKVLGIALLLVCALLVLSYAPVKWEARMGNFLHGQLDNSAEGRINAWYFAWNLTHDYPLTGGGFQAFSRELFQLYAPNPELFQGPHSIYFQMLGEQGFVGLGLFLLLLGSCWLTLRKLRKLARTAPSLAWVASYAEMFEIGLLAYMVSGAFLPRAYFDFYFELIACTILLKILAKREMTVLTETAEATLAAAELSEPVAP